MRVTTALTAALCLAVPAVAQIIPKDAGAPLEVLKPRGEFAKRLHGAVMPTGKGWKAVVDPDKRLQVMVPESWKLDLSEGRDMLRVQPPGAEKNAGLTIVFSVPRDEDPLEIDEDFATTYADSLAEDKMLKKLQFKPTDSGLVLARGLKFALAGGTMNYGKSETFQQEQLVYISEDRIVTLMFTARGKEFEKYSSDVAKIFASYMTLGMRKTDVD